MNTEKTEKLVARDFMTIGIFAAISLVIFFITGAAAGLTLVGTVANIPITVFFKSIAYMLLVSKVRKRGTFLIMGTINALPGLMAANVIGVVATIIGWAIVDVVASVNHYRSKGVLVFSYVLGCTLHSAGFTLPMYLSGAQYLTGRTEIFHLTDEALAIYLNTFNWPMYFGMVALTVVTSLLGALISIRITKRHFEKAGLL